MIYAENKRASFDYEILEKFEAGIELKGGEAKSITSGKANITGAYCIVKGGEIFVVNMDIPPHQKNNTSSSYNPKRDRRLLLKKSEIKHLEGKPKSLTIIPLKLYNKGSKIKMKIALVKYRKKKDKREILKKKEDLREIRKFV
jgi:SsrA-binding protein